MNLNTASPLTVLALGKLLSRQAIKAARDEVESGTHPVDVTLRVTGDLEIAEDGKRKPTVKVLTKATVALLLRRMGCTREDALALLESVFSDALNLDEDAREKLLAETGVDDALKSFDKKVLSNLPKLTCKGRVKANLEAEVFGPAIEVDEDLVSEAAGADDEAVSG
jgi:hypothetical protein